ncbi:hypothetical protein DPMN_002851 [Dreissena polymorpha]|uniref:Uncharacterized protein n=1 Tax=Dreissena polymorpha TaxID=45954 RepID=A0A9D4HS86_DREPO|nr:hypothetical protein DPMN_053482 [Dreissena polymorpha]KAH3780737.1 hypothetical protein DPMN_158559 [Dreissena polymorpha]KAH3878950.1 hypothetical protein DPMN_002851 [Dreissena polymorpha]
MCAVKDQLCEAICIIHKLQRIFSPVEAQALKETGFEFASHSIGNGALGYKMHSAFRFCFTKCASWIHSVLIENSSISL